MDSEKSITLFEIKKDSLPEYLLHNFFHLFVYNFSKFLLCKFFKKISDIAKY